MNRPLTVAIFEDHPLASMHVRNVLETIFGKIGITQYNIHQFPSFNEYDNLNRKPDMIDICFLDHNLIGRPYGDGVIQRLKEIYPKIVSLGISNDYQDYVDQHMSFYFFGTSKSAFISGAKPEVKLQELVSFMGLLLERIEKLNDEGQDLGGLH